MTARAASIAEDPPPHGVLDDEVDNLVLSGRARRAVLLMLHRRDDPEARMPISLLDAMSDEQILRCPNVGRSTVAQLRREIDRYLRRAPPEGRRRRNADGVLTRTSKPTIGRTT